MTKDENEGIPLSSFVIGPSSSVEGVEEEDIRVDEDRSAGIVARKAGAHGYL